MSHLKLSASLYEMSVFMRYYVAIICVAFLVSSILIPGISAQDQCVTEFNTDMTVETASLFSIQYVNNYKLVTNKKSNEIFVLYQCGSPVPTDIPTGAKLFQVPIKNVAVTDTSVIPFLELLGYRSAIKLLGSSDLISSPCLQLAKDSNEVTILTNNQTLNDIELQGVDLSFDSEAKPTDLKSVSGAPSSDPGVLNRVEWIKFYSVFFNGEAKANEVYGKIKSNYECFKNFANNNLQESKPIVAWVSYDAPSEFNQNIASWKIVDAVFKKQLTEDAGGSYFNITPLSFDTSTDFLKAIENVDILIDESFIGSSIDDVYNNFGIVEADKQKYKFVKNQAIYREDGTTNPNDGRDWFENAIAMGDASLEDMINVINPKLPKPDYNRIWLRNVAKDEPVKISSSANCTDPNNPLVSKADDCASIAKTSAKGTGAISSTPTFISCFISFVFVDIAMLFL